MEEAWWWLVWVGAMEDGGGRWPAGGMRRRRGAFARHMSASRILLRRQFMGSIRSALARAKGKGAKGQRLTWRLWLMQGKWGHPPTQVGGGWGRWG